MSDRLALDILYRLPTDGAALHPHTLAKMLSGSARMVSQSEVQTGINLLVDAGMAVRVGPEEYARADIQENPSGRDLRFAELVADVATTLLESQPQKLASRITDALGRIAGFIGSDRAYVLDYDFESRLAYYKYEWCADGISARIAQFPVIPFDSLDQCGWIDPHKRGQAVVINDVSGLDRQHSDCLLVSQDIKGVVALPVMSEDQCLGCVGFDSIGQPSSYRAESVRLLAIVARMLAILHRQKMSQWALEDARNNLDVIVEGTGVGTWILWPKTGRLDINENWARMLGYTRSELEPITVQTWERLSHPDDLAVAKNLLAQNFSGHPKPYDVQVRMRHKAGHWVPVQTRGRIILRDPKEGYVAVGIHQDFTEREQANRELQQLSNIINQSPVMAFRWRNQPGWPVEYVSDTVRNLGYRPEDFIEGPLQFHDLIHPVDAQRIESEVAEYIDHGPDWYRQTYRLRHKDGHWIWVDDFTWLTRDSGRVVTEINGVLLDVTDRKTLERDLELHATLINNSVDIVTLRDTDLKYRAANAAFLSLVNRSLEQVLDHTDDEVYQHLLSPAEIDQYQTQARQSLRMKRGESFVVEDHFLLARGETRTFRTRHFPVFDDQTEELLGTATISVDITDLERAQLALEQSEERFRGLLEHLPNVAVQGYDKNRRAIFWNRGSASLYGYTAAEAIGSPITDLVVPAERRRQFAEEIDHWLSGSGVIPSREQELQDKQGNRKLIYSSYALRQSPTGDPELYCIDVDLTAQKVAQQRMELLAKAFSHSYDGVVITDRDARIVEVNNRYCELTGYGRDEIIGNNPSMLHSGRQSEAFYQEMWQKLADQGNWIGQIWNKKKSGEVFAIETRITTLSDSSGDVVNYIANVTDITERLNYEDRLRHIAYYDELTGLPNRVSIAETLRTLLSSHHLNELSLAVVFLDLDEFKSINETHDQQTGDRYLKEVANRLQAVLREGDVAARFGGDEFVLVIRNLDKPDPEHPVFSRLISAMRTPVMIDGIELNLTASFGVTFYPQQTDVDADQLFRQADQAMYSAKQQGKNQIVFFDTEFERRILDHMARTDALRAAISKDELLLHYQPQVDLSAGKVLGVEALVRWKHPVEGLLFPGSFLDLIQNDESLGMSLTKWVLAKAMEDLQRLTDLGFGIGMSVNITIPARESLRVGFIDELRVLLSKHPVVDPGLLTLEIVENVLIDDLSQATKTIHDLQKQGVKISLDDFGTGFSSLSYLKHLSFDELKIDQGFVRDMLRDREDMMIVQAVISLSQSFNVPVIAEGVETLEHAEMLLRLGCLRAQGYGISRPVDFDNLVEWLRDWKPVPGWSRLNPIPSHLHPVVAMLSAHMGWVDQLEQYLRGKVSEPPVLDPRKCGFEETLCQHEAKPEFGPLRVGLDQCHIALHRAGEAAVNAFKAGDMAQAMQNFERAVAQSMRIQTLVWDCLRKLTDPR